MSRKYEDQCVGCPEWMGCLGSSCPKMNVPIDYCDICGYENAEYRIDGEDYCEDCAKKYVEDVFSSLDLTEKAEILKIDMRRIEN